MHRGARVWLGVAAALSLAAVALFLVPAGRALLSSVGEPGRPSGTGGSPGSLDRGVSPVLQGGQARRVQGGPQSGTTHQLTVRDVNTGAPIPGLGMRIAPRDGPAREAVSSAAGAIDVRETEEAASLSPVAEGWVLADEEVLATGGRVAWLYRLVEVRGRVLVRGGSGADRLQDTKVTVLAPLPRSKAGAPDKAIGSYAWMRERSLQQVREPTPVGADGRFSVRVPRLGGYHLAATLALVGAADLPLEFGEGDEAKDGIEMLLEESLVCCGVLKDQHGVVLANAEVMSECVAYGTADSLDRLFERAQALGLGVGTYCLPEKGCELFIQSSTRTDEAGQYRVEVPPGMELRIVVAVPGHQILRTTVGSFSGSKSDVELIAYSYGADSPRCQLCTNGAPLVGHTVLVTTSDVRSIGQNLGVTDASGRFPAEWLEAGQHYAVAVMDPTRNVTSYFMKWANERRIDTSELARRREDVK